MRPGRAALSARWTNVRLQGKGLLLGLRSLLVVLMKLRFALAQPVQSRFDPHHGLDAEAAFSLSSELSLSTSLSAGWKRRSWKATSLKSRAIIGPADFSPTSRKSAFVKTLGDGSLVGGSANHDCDTLTCFSAGRGGSVTERNRPC